MSITMQFPAGLGRFVDSQGTVVKPDANGQAAVDQALIREYLAAGFTHANLEDRLDTVDSDVAALEAKDALIAKAMSGDLVWSVTPATLESAPIAEAWQRTVNVALKTAAGEVHTWFNGALASGLEIADDSTAGTASIASNDLTLVAGAAQVVVSGDEAAWLDGESDTLTVKEATIMGYTVAAKTSVESFVAE